MNAKVDEVISELDEYIALCRKRLKTILSALNWTEGETLRDISVENLKKEDTDDEDDPPLPPSFECNNSVVIGVDQLKAITKNDTATIPKKFSDIQSNYTREQKREIYDYVIYNTRKVSEPELKISVLNDNQTATNMTIAQIGAKAKKNAKTQRRKYRTSKPTHIEEVRDVLNLQMEALNQIWKPKTVESNTNTSRKPPCDLRSPFISPSNENKNNRHKRREERSPLRRPSLDRINSFRALSCERANSRDNDRKSSQGINSFTAKRIGGRGRTPLELDRGEFRISESSYRKSSQGRSRESLDCDSPRIHSMDRLSRSRGTDSYRGRFHGRSKSKEPAGSRTPLRGKLNSSKESDRGDRRRSQSSESNICRSADRTYRAREKKRKSRESRYRNSGSRRSRSCTYSRSRSSSSSSSSSSTSRNSSISESKCRKWQSKSTDKRSQVKSKHHRRKTKKHRSRSKDNKKRKSDMRRSKRAKRLRSRSKSRTKGLSFINRSRSPSSLKKSTSRTAVGNMQQSTSSTQWSKNCRSRSKSPKPRQGQASPKKTKKRSRSDSKSRTQNEK